MFRNRISQFLSTDEPKSPSPQVPPGFIAVPMAQLPTAVQQAVTAQASLYQLAFTQAQQAAQDNPWIE
jgi:hypothetical protein